MKDSRRNRNWTLAGVLALAVTAGVASNRALARRAERLSVAGENLRDAVASPRTPATAGLAGKPVPTAWFKTPEQGRAEMDSALLASRRSRRAAFARRFAAKSQ